MKTRAVAEDIVDWTSEARLVVDVVLAEELRKVDDGDR
jgi:hypothetical protein